MLTIEDIKNGIQDITLYSKHFENNKEATLLFYFNVRKDDAWYEVEVGEYNPSTDSYHALDAHKFRSIKKAIDWWNKNLEGVTE